MMRDDDQRHSLARGAHSGLAAILVLALFAAACGERGPGAEKGGS